MSTSNADTGKVSAGVKAVAGIAGVLLNSLTTAGLAALAGKLLLMVGTKFSYPVGVGTSVVLVVILDMFMSRIMFRYPVKSPEVKMLKKRRLEITFLLFLPIGIGIGVMYCYY